jgi:hypothetical protein
MMTYKVGYAGSDAGAKAMAEYLLADTLDQQISAAATYYMAQQMPELPTLADDLGQTLNRGEISFEEALAELIAVDRAGRPVVVGETPPHWHLDSPPEDFATPRDDYDLEEATERLSNRLREAATRADFAAEQAPTTARLRPDLSPALAKALGIDPTRPLTAAAISNLLNVKRTDGNAIDGKRINQPMRSVAEVFGLDPERPPTGAALDNVLAGRRADGEAPRTANGKDMTTEAIAGPLKRFHTALGVKPGKEPTEAELAQIRGGRSAQGFDINANEYQRKIHATKAPIGFVDFTFSADKSLSVAWALAPTEVEKAAILSAHQ